MNAILIQLNTLPESNKIAWQQAAKEMKKYAPKSQPYILAGEGILLIENGMTLREIGPLLTAIKNCDVRYKVTFIEKSSEWLCHDAPHGTFD